MTLVQERDLTDREERDAFDPEPTGLELFRGLAIGLACGVMLWALIIAGIADLFNRATASVPNAPATAAGTAPPPKG